ncbi:MAG: hypothetical protein A3K10_12770 [Bacteroidetes bacterium RIFCSPLOWO2_12_FULL_31_6]|nr:MAG: hypothetical protein A3K10_12770 [Bacteroidetes bacterium RIFCSPLOWO2_12_FULL_31_6]
MTKKVELTSGIILLIVGILFFGFQTDQTKQNKESVFDGYPVPTDKNMLFYIQKSFNTNAVVYTANIGKDGKLNPDEPVKVFWRRYQEDGRIRELKYLEKQFAFGVDFKPIKGKENAYVFTLVSLKGMNLYLTLDKQGNPKIATIIAKKTASLKRVFVTAEHTKLLPKVFYVEVFGNDLNTGDFLYEKIDN